MQKDQRVVFLKGRKTVLRPVAEDDLKHFVVWMNDPEVRIFIQRFLPMTSMEEKEWLESLKKHSDKDIILIIQIGNKPIGVIGIHKIDWISKIGTTGAVIGEKSFWGKGYGTDAKMILLNYAFNTLGLRKVMSQVKAFNRRSLAYSIHCGCKIEGRLRKQHFVNGRYYDEIILGLFRGEWLPYWRKYNEK